MWKFIKIQLSGQSPMAEILRRCSDPRALRFVIYNLGENRVDCAAMPEQEVRRFSLDRDVVWSIKEATRDMKFAILAYDTCDHNVYLVDCTPELNAASAVLLCVVSELIGGGANLAKPQQKVYEYEGGCDYERFSPSRPAPEVVHRDARGRFIPKTNREEEQSRIQTGHVQRFHLGGRSTRR